MKIEGKFIFKVAGTLTAISLVVALLLGLTNMLTADKIAAINKQKTEAALAKVVSAADCEFPPMEEIPQAMIDALHNAGLHFVLWQIPVYKKQGPGEAPAPKMSWTARTPSTEGSVCTTPTGRPTRSLLGTGLPGR